MRPLASGLFPAAEVTTSTASSGYGNVWVRDDVFVAYAHHFRGASEVAARTVQAIFDYFWRHRDRFEAIIGGAADPDDVMRRPHVRFDGETLEEITSEKWPHAQNDALGYALWLFSKLVGEGVLELDPHSADMVRLFVRYFAAIRYWEDDDSGHWEERRKRSASSIGTVVAGLEALLSFERTERNGRGSGLELEILHAARDLATKGRRALENILPSECVDLAPERNRRYDAALLFLVHPLRVVDGPLATLVLSDIERFLTGAHGVRRYLGDSYWAPDYDERMSQDAQTIDYSEKPEARDALLDAIGHEAQWCLFDPMISAHYGARYLETGARLDFERQAHHFERSLAQITDDWKCPELYFLRRGVYTPNPHTPLLWTQANLSVALTAMQASLQARVVGLYV